VEWGYLPAPAATAPGYFAGERTYELEPGGLVRKTSAAWIDLGGIAKGYAVDLAISTLQRHGVTSACVNAGGDLRVFGPDAWPVAVRAPRAPSTTGRQLSLRNAALATSGNYFSAKQFREQMMVSPLIDGRNGRAVMERQSVSVHARSCALADALTKVVMASGDVRHHCVAAFNATAFII
jgi:thiamine biosynthesis lipoprotein